mmetsp:Transcript_26612/g.63119  ORF Transcript_26612/g.63119 Transcript_26612/m.63119 type:complete len:312 (-) Transcript_26612:1449-2384(-)
MPAFSIMVADFLFLQTALPFGTDFSPQNWEVCRRIIEALSERLFADKTLRAKHRKYLDRIKFGQSLTRKPKHVVVAKACSQRQGILDGDGKQRPTPHRLFVDDGIYAEVFKRRRIEQAIAASIEAIFIVLGRSGTPPRQPFAVPPRHLPVFYQSSINARTPSPSISWRRCLSTTSIRCWGSLWIRVEWTWEYRTPSLRMFCASCATTTPDASRSRSVTWSNSRASSSSLRGRRRGSSSSCPAYSPRLPQQWARTMSTWRAPIRSFGVCSSSVGTPSRMRTIDPLRRAKRPRQRTHADGHTSSTLRCVRSST